MPVPEELAPEAPAAVAAVDGSKVPQVDGSLLAIVEHWRLVVADLLDAGIDLWDPAVRARPWPGVRTKIFSLLDPGSQSRLRAALIRR
jgi:hypothetical protein